MARTNPYREIGNRGRSQWGAEIRLGDSRALRGLAALRVYDQMRRDDATGMMMYMALSLPIRHVSWSCQPGGDGTDDAAAAAFAWECFDSMSLSFSDVISDVCLMFPFGWSLFEMVLKRRADGRVGFQKLAFRPQQTLASWVYADDGDIKAMKQYTPHGGIVSIPLSRALLFRTSREGDEAEGISIYRPAVRAWKYRRKLERVEGIGLYRRWAGFPNITLPEGATGRGDVAEGEMSDEERAEELVQAIYEDRMMGSYMPAGWQLTLGGPEGKVDSTMGETIMRKDAEMARAVLAQFLLLGLKSVGTQSLAETLLDVFASSIEAYLENITQEFNRYAIPYLFRYNTSFPDGTALPVLAHTSPRRVDLDAVGTYIAALGRAGLLSADVETEAFLRSLVPGMPEPGEGANRQDVGDNRSGGDDGAGEGSRRGGVNFNIAGVEFSAKPAPVQRPATYNAAADANAAAQRANLEALDDDLATAVEGMGPDTSEEELRSTLNDIILAALLVFRERSMLDIGAAFWLGFGKPSGGPEQLAALEREVAEADSWIGYNPDGSLRRVNPAGKPTLFGDIAGTMEGRIAAILLLLKQGRTDEAVMEVRGVIRSTTRGYSRGAQYAGHVWHGIWEGAHQREMYDVVQGGQPARWRWVNDPAAAHCTECPIYGSDPPGREYPSWDAMVSFTGGTLPGMGTECDGYCRCHLETEYAEGWGWA